MYLVKVLIKPKDVLDQCCIYIFTEWCCLFKVLTLTWLILISKKFWPLLEVIFFLQLFLAYTTQSYLRVCQKKNTSKTFATTSVLHQPSCMHEYTFFCYVFFCGSTREIIAEFGVNFHVAKLWGENYQAAIFGNHCVTLKLS